MGARTSVGAVVVTCALALALTGCGDDDPAAPPDPSGSPTASSGSPSATASETPTEAPSVTPAAGPVLKMEVAEVNAPTGWEHEEQLVPLEDGARKSGQRMSLTETPAFGSTLDEVAKVKLKGYGDGQLKRLADTEIAGVPAAHIADRGPRGYYELTTEDTFTAVYRDKVISVVFQLDRDVPEAKRQQLVAEVLASLVWK